MSQSLHVCTCTEPYAGRNTCVTVYISMEGLITYAYYLLFVGKNITWQPLFKFTEAYGVDDASTSSIYQV